MIAAAWWLMLLAWLASLGAAGSPGANRPPELPLPTPATPQAALLGSSLSVAPLRPIPLPDPFPIQRLATTGPHLEELLRQLPAGPIRQMPRAEFEAAVRAAPRSTAAPQAVLLDAQYQATWVPQGSGRGYLQGNAELTWQVPQAGSCYIVERWTAALESLETSQGQPVARSIDRKGREVWWFRQAGRQTLKLRWSQAARPTDDQAAFDWAGPTVPTSQLICLSPAGWRVQSAALISSSQPNGPSLPEAEGLLRTTIPLGSGAALFQYRPTADAALQEVRPNWRATRTARFTLGVSEVQAEFRYSLESLRTESQDLTLELDSAWQVQAWQGTTSLRLATQDPQSVGADGRWPASRRLNFRWDGPAPTELLIRVVAPRPRWSREPTDWRPPAVRLAQGILAHDVQEFRWERPVVCSRVTPGDYRIVPSSNGDGAGLQLERLAWQSSPELREPQLAWTETEATLRWREQVDWQILPQPRWKASATLQVLQGPLERIPVSLPAGWRLQRVDTSDDKSQGVIWDGQQMTLLRPARTGDTVELRYELIQESSPTDRFTVPRLGLPDTVDREGTMRLRPRPGHRTIFEPNVASWSGTEWTWKTRGIPLDIQVREVPIPSVASRAETETNPAEQFPGSEEWIRRPALLGPIRIEGTLPRVGRPRLIARGAIRAISGGRLEIRVAPGTEIESIRLGGRFTEAIEIDGDRWWIPVPRDAERPEPELELQYRLPQGVAWPGVEFPAAESVTVWGQLEAGLRILPRLEAPPDWFPISGLPPRTISTRLVAGGVAALAWASTLLVGLILARRPTTTAWPRFTLAIWGLLGLALWTLPAGWAWGLRPFFVTWSLLGFYRLWRTLGWWPWPTLPSPAVNPTNSATVALGLVMGLSVVGTGWRSQPVQGQGPANPAGPAAVSPPTTIPPREFTDRVVIWIRPEGEFAFVPEALWLKLHEAALPEPPRWIQLDSSVQLEGSMARVSVAARWERIDPQAQRYELPFPGVALETVELNGQRLLIETHPTSPDRTLISLPARNPATPATETVTVRFQVPIRMEANQAELRWTGPDFSGHQLEILWPGDRPEPDSPGRRGGWVRTPTSCRLALGRQPECRLRWNLTTTTPTPTSLRAAAVWDLQDRETQLIAAWQNLTETPPPLTVTWMAPPGWEPAFARLRTGPTSTNPVWNLKTVRWDPATRLWTVRLPRLEESNWTLVTRWIPQGPLPAQPRLVPPRWIDAPRGEFWLGLRRGTSTFDELERFQVIDYPPDDLQRVFGPIPEFRLDRAPPDRVFSAQTLEAAITPKFLRTAEPLTWQAEHRWTVTQSAWYLTVGLTFRANRPLYSLEFQSDPGLIWEDLLGNEVSGWSVREGLVQVLFRAPPREGALTLRARWPGPAPVRPGRIDLPLLQGPNLTRTAALILPRGWFAKPAESATVINLTEPTPIPNDTATWPLVWSPTLAPRTCTQTSQVSRAGTNLRHTIECRLRLPAGQATFWVVHQSSGSLGPLQLVANSLSQAIPGPRESTPEGNRQRWLALPQATETEVRLRFEQTGPSYEGNPVQLGEIQFTGEPPELLDCERTLQLESGLRLVSGPTERTFLTDRSATIPGAALIQEPTADAPATWRTPQRGAWSIRSQPRVDPLPRPSLTRNEPGTQTAPREPEATSPEAAVLWCLGGLAVLVGRPARTRRGYVLLYAGLTATALGWQTTPGYWALLGLLLASIAAYFHRTVPPSRGPEPPREAPSGKITLEEPPAAR